MDYFERILFNKEVKVIKPKDFVKTLGIKSYEADY